MAVKRLAIPFKEMQLKAVGPRDAYLVARVQRLDMPTNITVTDIDELGNNQHAGTTTDVPEVSGTFQLMDVSIKAFAALTGTDPQAYPAAGVDISALTEVDLVGQVKDASVADYVKTVHLRRCQIDSFTFTYSVDGESTEEYSVVGSKKRWFKNDVVVDTFTGSPLTSPLTLSQTPIQLKSGDYAMTFRVEGEYWPEVSGAPSTEEYSISGTSLTFDDSASPTYAVAVYHANPAGSNWSYVSDALIPAAIRGRDVQPLIGAANLERVQSVTIRGRFPNEAITEMGNRDVVGYITQVPTVEGDLTVLDTDLELIALLTTGNASSSDTEFDMCELTASGIALEVQLLDPADGCNDPTRTVLKTVYIPAITITSEGHTTNVGGNASQTFGWRSTTGQCIVYSGARP